jgi:hypothetical protein
VQISGVRSSLEVETDARRALNDFNHSPETETNHDA